MTITDVLTYVQLWHSELHVAHNHYALTYHSTLNELVHKYQAAPGTPSLIHIMSAYIRTNMAMLDVTPSLLRFSCSSFSDYTSASFGYFLCLTTFVFPPTNIEGSDLYDVKEVANILVSDSISNETRNRTNRTGNFKKERSLLGGFVGLRCALLCSDLF